VSIAKRTKRVGASHESPPVRNRHMLIAERLGAWFETAKRDLPWRKTKDPYAIWLSEVMLQQTRVATVLDYFPRFLDRFPTVKALAEADTEEVLGAWSGLGYYRRARALQLGAREVLARYGGELPDDAVELRSVPGIGPYTAGAIASIAFGKREPLVDGNVARVFARLFGLDFDVRSTRGLRELWKLAADLVPEKEPGRHNEALMELGATICLPGEPKCSQCPLHSECVAAKTGRQKELPVLAKKKAPPVVPMVALLAYRDGEVLLGQRGPTGLFAKMWEPPMFEASGEPGEALGALLGELRDAHEVGEVRHVLSHRELHVRVIAAEVGAELPEARAPYVRFAWVGAEELSGRGVSTLARKVMAASRQGVKTAKGLEGAAKARRRKGIDVFE